MRKCPDCAEENIDESLFCKHCGRCLLAPEPEKRQRSTATHIEGYKTTEGIDLYDGPIVKKSRADGPKIRHQPEPSVMVRWLLLLNVLVFILLAEIAKYIVSR